MTLLPPLLNNCSPCLWHLITQPGLTNAFNAVAHDEHAKSRTVGIIYFCAYHINNHQQLEKVT